MSLLFTPVVEDGDSDSLSSVLSLILEPSPLGWGVLDSKSGTTSYT